MRYLGGKVRLGKHIVKHIIDLHKPNQVYYEPFVGGLGLFRYIPIEWVRVINDLDSELIALWQAVAVGYEPPNELSKADYNRIKSTPNLLDCKPYERAFIAYFCSFGGKKWGGYAQGENRNFYNEAHNDIVISQRKDSLSLRHIIHHATMLSMDYSELPYVPNSLIYCDPPYKATTGYTMGEFDSDYFYKWCKLMTIKGHTVLVSEYTAPNSWLCLWSKDKKVSVSRYDYGTKTEKLFLVR